MRISPKLPENMGQKKTARPRHFSSLFVAETQDQQLRNGWSGLHSSRGMSARIYSSGQVTDPIFPKPTSLAGQTSMRRTTTDTQRMARSQNVENATTIRP